MQDNNITKLFQKRGYDLNACNNVRDSLYNTDVINQTVKLIVHTPVGKLVYYNWGAGGGVSNITLMLTDIKY